MEIDKYFDKKMCTIVGVETFRKEKNLSLAGIKYSPNYEKYEMGYCGKQNPNIVVLKYKVQGKDIEEEYLFHKENAYALYCSIVGDEFVKNYGITKIVFDNYCRDNGLINVLENNIKNNSFVLLEKKLDAEISQKPITCKKAITSFKSDFTFNSIFADNVEYEECYRYNNENVL
jgi:hypothetical protein